jgi:protein phosphatase
MARKRLFYEIGNGTDVGNVREHNEDSFTCMEPDNRRQENSKGRLLVVCDGMGGAVGGKTASTVAIEAISEVYYRHRGGRPSDALVAAIREANHRIHRRAQAEPELEGMGTTAVAVAVIVDEAHIAHVGDSRCYLVRDGSIRQLTEDHSMVGKMVRDGLLTPEQARNHPEGHILNRSVGVGPDVEVDARELFPLKAGDALVLCSDGLSNQVEDSEILQAVESMPPQEAAARLISLAKERGGSDNITVQIIRASSKAVKKKDADVDTAIRRAPRLRRKKLRAVFVLLLILALLAGGAYFLWLYEIVDFAGLLNQDWIPEPPEHLYPFK